MDQTILVTGSSSGFGRLIAETLARQGHTVFAGMRAVAGRNAPAADELRALARRDNLSLHVVDMDVTDDASVQHAIESIVGMTGRLDVVVNNAGVAYWGPLEAYTIDQAQQQFDTNVFGVLRVNRSVLPHMRRQGSGLLVQIGSIAGRVVVPFAGLYTATKFALEGLTESYRDELAPFGIDAAIVEPGTYPTPISAHAVNAADPERAAPYQGAFEALTTQFFAENRSSTPPDPQEVADAVAGLIGKPAGQRPLHTVVAPAAQRGGPEAVNDAATRATRSFFEALALPLATLAPERDR